MSVEQTPWGEPHQGYCHKRQDETHCEHWWDGEPCHDCGAQASPDCEACGEKTCGHAPDCPADSAEPPCGNCGEPEDTHPTFCNESDEA
jgi:hypothetical protein